MKRIAIIGGGISGLTAAFRLEERRRQGAPLEYVLFEASHRFGGVVQTDHVDEFVVEAGPDSFLTGKVWAADLCRELELGDYLITSNDARRRTYVVLKGQLVPLPDGLMFMVPTKPFSAFFSPLFSWKTKLRMIREWFYAPIASDEDISVAKFVEQHYGREMVDRVAGPLLAGVYGGSADELSVRSVLPLFVEMEAKFGSLGKAMVRSSREREKFAGSEGRPRAAAPTRGVFTSLKNGMQQMADALLARIPDDAKRLNTPVTSVRPESGKWLVIAGGRTEEFDGVIVGTPAYVTSALLCESNAEFRSTLASIRYSSSVTMAFAYDVEISGVLPPGFGFLLPETENERLIAATFVHNKFPHRAPDGCALIRCFLGGTRDEAILQLSDGELTAIVRRELEAILGIKADPRFVRIYRWKQAMAQYGVGHRERVERIRMAISGMPGLGLGGNYLGGIGVPDCVRSGSEAAAKVLAELNIPPADFVDPRR